MTYSVVNAQGEPFASLIPTEEEARAKAQEIANVNRKTVYVSLEVTPEPTNEEIDRLRGLIEERDDMLREFLRCGDDGGRFADACLRAAALLARKY